MNSQSFSQSVTDTSYVKLPKTVAQEVVRELVRKDYLEKEVNILTRQIENKDETIINRNTIINRLENRIDILQRVNNARQEQIQTYIQLNNSLKQDLRREKFRKNVYKYSTTGILIGAVILVHK